MTVDIDVTPEPEPVADDAPDVVVVDTGDSGGSDDIATGVMLGALTEKVEALEAQISELRLQQQLSEIETPAPDVEEVAEVVAEVVAEALAEEEEPEPVEPDTTPDRVHWAHRSRHELLSKGDN